MKNFFLKQILIWSLIIVVLVMNSGAAYASNDRYRKLDGEKKFSEIKEELINSTQNIAHYKASEANQELVKALSDFKKLRETVKKAQNIDDVIDEVADGLNEISLTYENVSKIGKDLIKFRNGNFQHLQEMSNETIKTEKEIEKETSRLEEENKRLQQKLISDIDEIDKNNVQVSIKGNMSIINSLKGQSMIWKKFYEAQTNLLSKLKLNSRKVDSLLHILEVNSRVYKEAANVAKLRKTAKSALDNLSSLGDLQKIIGDLQNSWVEVDDLVSDISNAEFTVDID